MNQEFPDVQAGVRKDMGTRNQMASMDLNKPRGFQKKKSTSASLTMLKLLTMWITKNHVIFLKRWEYQTTILTSWKICMQVKKQQLEMDMEQ